MKEQKQQFPFRYQDKQIMENLLEDVSLIIKDSDASREKEIVNRFLRKVSETFLFVTIGSSGVGKSTFLHRLFSSVLPDEGMMENTRNIKEYRYGVLEDSVCVNEYVTRIFTTKEELDGLQIVDMQGLDQIMQDGLKECVKNYLYKSSVILVVFDVRRVRDYAVWDILEEVETRKVIFVLTKCDLEKDHIIEEHEKKLRQYMKEAGIQAPIFRVSSHWEDSLRPVRDYVSNQVIGSSPVSTRQQENLAELKKMLLKLSESFHLRRQQYESDAVVLKKINASLDEFILNNRVKIEDLKAALKREIEKEIAAYVKEVTAKLDPCRIKERFPNGSTDFVDYLSLVNEGYQKRMTDQVNRKTQETVQIYLAGLEKVLDGAVNCLNKRENILELKDKFYGTMAQSKKSMVYKAASQIEVTKDYYHSLADASEELFMELWKARGVYERVLANAEVAGGALGAVAGAGMSVAGTFASVMTAIGAKAGTAAGVKAGVAAGTAAGAKAGVAAGTAVGAKAGVAAVVTAVNAVGAVLWPVVGAVIGALVIARIAKKIASANTLPELEKKTAEAIAEFRDEAEKNKAEITEQIFETIEKLFVRETEGADKLFMEFRMSVNIEEKNMFRLEDKLNAIQGYLQQIEELEERRGLEI